MADALLSLTRFSTRTILEPQPRVNGKQINLLKLFNDVVERGGYDAVSAEKLAWRKLGHEFGLGSSNVAAYAFLLKTVYYNNLAYVLARRFSFAHTNTKPVPMKSRQSTTGSLLPLKFSRTGQPGAAIS